MDSASLRSLPAAAQEGVNATRTTRRAAGLTLHPNRIAARSVRERHWRLRHVCLRVPSMTVCLEKKEGRVGSGIPMFGGYEAWVKKQWVNTYCAVCRESDIANCFVSSREQNGGGAPHTTDVGECSGAPFGVNNGA